MTAPAQLLKEKIISTLPELNFSSLTLFSTDEEAFASVFINGARISITYSHEEGFSASILGKDYLYIPAEDPSYEDLPTDLQEIMVEKSLLVQHAQKPLSSSRGNIQTQKKMKKNNSYGFAYVPILA